MKFVAMDTNLPALLFAVINSRARRRGGLHQRSLAPFSI